MKWYNKERTQMVNLDKVDAWFYFPEMQGSAPNITFFINGAQFESDGEEAIDFYNILKEQKEVLHS